MKRSANPMHFLSQEETARIELAVGEAEKASSAEVKLVIVRHCWGDIRRKAAEVFHKHQLDRTAKRNCVLILLVTANREFLIYGDEGIHSRVGQGFWDDVRDRMTERFRQDRFADGLVEAIHLVGEKLAEFFPPSADDRNEITDGVEYGQ